MHALLMILGVAVLLPLGVMFVRFGDRVEGPRGWFFYHKHIQVLGVMFMAAGFGLALYMQTKFNAPHFRCLHSILGLTLLCAVALQFLGGMLRPPEYAPRRGTWRWLHVLPGWFILAASVIVVALGFELADAAIYFVCLYALLPATFLIVFIVSEYRDRSPTQPVYAALPAHEDM